MLNLRCDFSHLGPNYAPIQSNGTSIMVRICILLLLVWIRIRTFNFYPPFFTLKPLYQRATVKTPLAGNMGCVFSFQCWSFQALSGIPYAGRPPTEVNENESFFSIEDFKGDIELHPIEAQHIAHSLGRGGTMVMVSHLCTHAIPDFSGGRNGPGGMFKIQQPAQSCLWAPVSSRISAVLHAAGPPLTCLSHPQPPTVCT